MTEYRYALQGASHNSFDTQKTFAGPSGDWHHYSLPALCDALSVPLAHIPYSIRILLENLLRH